MRVLKEIGERETLLQAAARDLRQIEDLPRFEAKGVPLILEIRVATIGVLDAIRLWRELMWNPHPFVWNSQNYILKLAHDQAQIFGECDIVARLRPFVRDLVLFLPAASSCDARFETEADRIPPQLYIV